MFIYIIGMENSNAVKIGVASNPESRLRQLQSGNPYRLQLIQTFKATEAKERFLHARFREYKLIGEWFDFGKQNPIELVTDGLVNYDPNWKNPSPPLDELGQPMIQIGKDHLGATYWQTRAELIDAGMTHLL